MTDGRDAEPFEQTTRPAAYVPRPETEQLLDHLQTWALSGSTASIRLTGAAGMGKSLLLRVLAMRTAGQPTAVHVPYPNLMPDDLATWVIEAIGEQRGRDSQAQLVAAAKQRATSGGLLLLIDDAERLPTQTRDALDLWFQRSEGSLRSVRA
ncbi:MAG: AAA family ATPase, partial [Deltaproteobacteria bacterium]|nr:AAA family ATPase [Deltaproteobacteria bacterium]